jgi:nucleoside-diphosphate-sugar epimerase
VIINLAARTDLSGRNLADYKVNFEGAANLIEACNSNSKVQKIVFVSSMLVCKAGYIPKSSDDYCPDTTYGESKMKMEQLIKSSQISANWVIVRPTSIWGPWFGQPYRKFFDMLRDEQYLDIGSYSATKTYGYVGNTCHQISKLCDKNKGNGMTLYLGDKPPIFISEWSKEITGQLNLSEPRNPPYFLFKIAALFGDMLGLLKLSFPLTSFRLKNMTTNNILPLEELYKITGEPPFSRKEGIKKTNEWMNNSEK